jgi:hypothetical protein
LGRRARKRRAPAGEAARRTPAGGAGPAAREGGNGALRRGYARGRERDEAIRAKLRPLAPGERPWPLKASAALALIIALANLAVMAAGWEVDGERPIVGGLAFAAIMLAAAAGLWTRRYWAVLGFQALLAISMVFAFLALLRAGNLEAVLLCLGVIAVAGPLFWGLVRVLARLQLPRRGGVG